LKWYNYFISFICLLVISCGYEKPEGDKYPEVPEFPKTNNEEVYFEEIPTDFVLDIPVQWNEFYIVETRTGDLKLRELNFYDSNFSKISEVEIPLDVYHFNHDGSIYIMMPGKNRNDRYYAHYQTPNFTDRLDSISKFEPKLDSIISNNAILALLESKTWSSEKEKNAFRDSLINSIIDKRLSRIKKYDTKGFVQLDDGEVYYVPHWNRNKILRSKFDKMEPLISI
jgi:hypothetical protein